MKQTNTLPIAGRCHNESKKVNTFSLSIVLALASVYFIWGSTYLAIKIALESFPPFGLGAIRFTTAGFVMYMFLRCSGLSAPTPLQWRDCAILGTLLLAGGNGLVCVAEQTVSSGLAAIALASMPLWTAVFAGWFGQWPSHRDWLGLSIGFAGVLTLNISTQFQASFIGAVCLIAAPLFWSFGSVWSRSRKLPDARMSTAAQMITGGVALWLLSLISGENISINASVEAWMALIYLTLFGSIVAFSAYVFLLRNVRPALATSYAYVNPPIAVLLGVFLIGEHTSWWEITAMVIILYGVILITKQKH